MKVSDILEEYKELPSHENLEVLTLTEKNGFVPQADRFHKRLATQDTSKYRVVNTGDFAYNPYLLWAGAIAVNERPDPGIISPVYPTFRLKEGFDPGYIFALLLSPLMLKRYDTISYGSVPRRRRAATKDFLNLTVPDIPPLEEQQRIATILGTVEEAITDATTTFESISALRQSVFKKFVRPDHPTQELGEIVSIQSGGTPSKKKPEYWGGDIPWYSPKDFKARYLSDSIDHITELAVSNANAKILPGRTPAVVVRGMILAHSFPVAVLETPGAINQDVKALHLNEDSIYSVDFLAEALRANAQYALTKVLTSSHGTKRLETQELAKLPIPVMSKDDIKEFDRVFSCLTELANYRQEKMNRLHELYASLSSRAFSGEL